MVVGCGLLIHLAVKAIEFLIHPKQDVKVDGEASLGGESIRAICKTVDKIIRNESLLEAEYEELHRQDGGLQVLIGAATTFLDSTKSLHRVVKTIQENEKIVHEKS